MEKDLLTCKEFTELTGIPSSTLRKWLGKERLDGVKQDGMWMIHRSQIQCDAVLARTGGAPPPPAEVASAPTEKKAPRAKTQTYSISEFSKRTYLTEEGVEDWLKNGRLKGARDDAGQWRVDAANLDAPDIQRLVRE